MSIIHYYSLCWNEEKILPFVLDYYSSFCGKLLIMDNESDDNSISIIESYKNAQVESYSSKDEIRDDLYLEIKNNIWKQSKGKADWVIVCDIDEILYHPNLEEVLKRIKKEGYSIIKPYGFDMYSRSFPQKSLFEVRTGVADFRHLRKCIIFDPNLIDEINFKAGCHKCYPLGKVKIYSDPNFKLLHYKNLDLDYLLFRNKRFKERLSQFNIENKLGKHYLIEEQNIASKYEENIRKAFDVFLWKPKSILNSFFRFFAKK